MMKRPIRSKELSSGESVLFRNLINSMNREVFKAKTSRKRSDNL